MSEFWVRNLSEPEETVELPGVKEELVDLSGLTVARVVHEPGWRWSKDVAPLVDKEWCDIRHVGIVVSGRMRHVFPDGAEVELGPDDAFDIPPGHDGLVLGDEPFVTIEWAGARAFAGQRASFSNRFLATLLITDIVGSTERAAAEGDVRWRELLTHHYDASRAQIEQYRGSEVETTGDGILAVFDGPAVALRCAASIRDSANRSGITVRVGIHVGEVERVGKGLRGIALHEATRVLSTAEPDEILVSETTRVLALAAGLTFEDRGEHVLKGLEGARRLYAYVT